MIMFMILLGTFIVNIFPALVIFDLGASWSFVSQSFSWSYDMALRRVGVPVLDFYRKRT